MNGKFVGKFIPFQRGDNRYVVKIPKILYKYQEYQELSKEAKKRLKWIEYYNKHNKNAWLTARYYGISSQDLL